MSDGPCDLSSIERDNFVHQANTMIVGDTTVITAVAESDHTAVEQSTSTISIKLDAIHLEKWTNGVDYGIHDRSSLCVDFDDSNTTVFQNGNETKLSSESDDDFCDFEGYSEFNPNPDKDTTSIEKCDHFKPTEPKNDMNFANFESNNWDTECNDKNYIKNEYEDQDFGDEEDFADFKSALNHRDSSELTNTSAKILSNCSTLNELIAPNENWNLLFQNTFSESENTECAFNNELNNVPLNIFDDCSPQSKLLWKNLQEMDFKIICLHNWKRSNSFQRFLQALKLNSQIEFSSLGQILEPVASNWSSNIESNDVTDKLRKSNNQICLPPTENDFQPSLGLTQDLDFFETKYSSKNSTTNTMDGLISELESTILENENDVQEVELSKTAQSISPVSSVNNLREMINNTIARTNNEQVLSAEALQILNELPNLSFIRAKVLMFPINDKST